MPSVAVRMMLVIVVIVVTLRHHALEVRHHRPISMG
jgi:hypothetical protein